MRKLKGKWAGRKRHGMSAAKTGSAAPSPAGAPRPEAAGSAPRKYDRLGLDDSFHDLLGLSVPLIRMPVAPGRSLAIPIEVAARNQHLRARGRHAARDLVACLKATLQSLGAELDAAAEEDAERGDPV